METVQAARVLSLMLGCFILSGCKMSAPMMVLREPRLPVPPTQRVAIAPIAAPTKLARDFEQALLAQRPTTRPDLEMVASAQLISASPIRLASATPLTSDLTAIHAARAVGANVLLIGEVIQDDLGVPTGPDADLPPELNAYRSGQKVGALPAANLQRPERIAMAWRVIDVASGDCVGGHTLAIDRIEADRRYPDLQFVTIDGRERVIAAGARQTWQAITPYVEKEDAILALPWMQLGASKVRRGNGYARQGRWDLAEAEWTEAERRYPFSNAAKHNLALAYAAREDFSAAKQKLGEMNFLRSRSLQSETLVWLDARHRSHTKALGLPPPPEGFAFPEPPRISANEAAIEQKPESTAPGPDELPLWTAIPFTKPPGWTWRAWLLQPWVL